MRIYVKCPNCNKHNKVYSESREIREGVLYCRFCGRSFCIKPGPGPGEYTLEPIEVADPGGGSSD